jgi:hypothetical protein
VFKRAKTVHVLDRAATVIGPLTSILSQINPVHSFPTNLFQIHSNAILLSGFGVQNELFPSEFHTKIPHAFLLPLSLDFMTVKLFTEGHKLQGAPPLM